jgi:3,4-dihydroxy 2-butanone 4-phosphate synthase
MLEKAIRDLCEGKTVLLHDAGKRENEVDMVVHAAAVTADTIKTMRRDGGGLICLAIGAGIAQELELPYMIELMAASNDTVRSLIPEKTPYGDRPAFSLSVNHKGTYTGVTDRDRTLTITEFPKLKTPQDLADNYYAPGHVHLLIAKELTARRGHTELSVELARRASLTPHMVLCEMMSDDHDAASVAEAGEYADRNNLILLDGGEM